MFDLLKFIGKDPMPLIEVRTFMKEMEEVDKFAQKRKDGRTVIEIRTQHTPRGMV